MLIGNFDMLPDADIGLTNLTALHGGDMSGLTDGSAGPVSEFEVVSGASDAFISAVFADFAEVRLVHVAGVKGLAVGTPVFMEITVVAGVERTASTVYRTPEGRLCATWALPAGTSALAVNFGIPAGTVANGTQFYIGELCVFLCADVKVQPTISIDGRGGPDVQLAESGRPSVAFTPVARILSVETIPVPDYSDWEQLRGTLSRMPFTAVCLDPSTPANVQKSSMMCVPSTLGQIRSFGAQRYYTLRLGFTEIVSLF